MAFVKRFYPLKSHDEPVEEDDPNKEPTFELPPTTWKMTSIPNEAEMPDSYFTNLKKEVEKFELDEIFEWERGRLAGEITDKARA